MRLPPFLPTLLRVLPDHLTYSIRVRNSVLDTL